MTNQEPENQRVLSNDFRRQWREVGSDVLAATQRVGESGWYVLGEEVKAVEAKLAMTLGRRHVVGCANGLDAIEIGLRALGIKPKDRVLTTSLTAFATTLAIVRAGGVPVFVDVDAYGLLDLDLAREALERDRTIRFMVPVHLYGNSLDLDKLAAIRNDLGVHVIEDCCQAICASWKGLGVGSVGEANALSFYPTKNLGALGDGGAIFTDSSALDQECRVLRDYGQSSRYRHDVIGLNSRLDELHAAVLHTALLPRLLQWTARRESIAQRYLDCIRNESVVVPGAPAGSKSVWHLFPVLVDAGQRESFRSHLERALVCSAVHYPELISRQAALAAVPFECVGRLSWTERYCQSEVTLPIHPHMTDSEIERVILAVNSWNGA